MLFEIVSLFCSLSVAKTSVRWCCWPTISRLEPQHPFFGPAKGDQEARHHGLGPYTICSAQPHDSNPACWKFYTLSSP